MCINTHMHRGGREREEDGGWGGCTACTAKDTETGKPTQNQICLANICSWQRFTGSDFYPSFYLVR